MFIISFNALVTALAGREARGGFKNNNSPRNFSISNVIGFCFRFFFFPNKNRDCLSDSKAFGLVVLSMMSFSCLYDHSLALLQVFGNNRKITVATSVQFCGMWISATPLSVTAEEQRGRISTREDLFTLILSRKWVLAKRTLQVLLRRLHCYPFQLPIFHVHI